VVLVDHAAEELAALYWRVQRHDDRPVLVGWPLLPGLMRTMAVVVRQVSAQHRPQMGLTVDQYPVRDLSPDCSHPAFGIAIAPHRQLHPIRMIGTGLSG